MPGFLFQGDVKMSHSDVCQPSPTGLRGEVGRRKEEDKKEQTGVGKDFDLPLKGERVRVGKRRETEWGELEETGYQKVLNKGALTCG